VNLASAANYVVLAYDSVTNVPASTLCGGLGEYPGASVTGAPVVTCGGATDLANPAALQAQTDLNAAYGDAAGRSGTPLASSALGGLTLVPGVYSAASLDIASATNLTLDGTGYVNGGVFIFQTAGSLTTAASTQVILTGGALASNVYWQVAGPVVSLGATSIFKGTIMAYGYVAVGHLTVLDGRAMSKTTYVSLDNDTINTP
jgi:hypothetical protein